MAPSTYAGKQRRWTTFVPIVAALVVAVEILFLGHLDMDKNADVARRWTTSFYFSSNSSSTSTTTSTTTASSRLPELEEGEESCAKWLEKADAVPHKRDFRKDPIRVSASSSEDWKSCSVGCKFGSISDRKPDATFDLPQKHGTTSVHRSMESSHYYPENNLEQARRRGFDIVMTTSLSSDVPVGYFSWAEYDIMAPVYPKTEDAMAAAFISNCGARNFRLQALEMLQSLNIKIDSYGSCHRNRDGRVNKVEALRHYKFSLAFENSNEEDYVTEKFFQSLVAGTIPVVVGAPNIQDFAPSPESILHIKQLDDVNSIAKTMNYLASNPEAYNQSMRWKYDGPSDSFKALVDMAAVHSSCRLCIYLATKIHEKEEAESSIKNRPCKCSGSFGMLYHLYVRERGRFQLESVFLRSSDMTIKGLESAVLKKFISMNHEPIWMNERPKSIRGKDYKVYRIYPLGMTQRQALYTYHFDGDDSLRRYVESIPCPKLEVIFV